MMVSKGTIYTDDDDAYIGNIDMRNQSLVILLALDNNQGQRVSLILVRMV